MGQKLVRSKRVIAALILLCAACKPQKAVTSKPNAPQIAATVVTIETTIEPSNKKLTHSLVIAGDHARAGDELDVWRLFDLKQKSVTYVDEIAKSYRTESIARTMMPVTMASVPRHLRATFRHPGGRSTYLASENGPPIGIATTS